MRFINHPLVQFLISLCPIAFGLSLLGILPGLSGNLTWFSYFAGGVFLLSGIAGLANLLRPRKQAEGPIELNEADLVEVNSLVAKGNEIEAIKIVRQKTGASLADAKDFVVGLKGEKRSF